MLDRLLQLLGYDAAGSATKVSSASLGIAGVPVWLVVLLLIALGGAAWMLYRRESSLSRGRRVTLGTLRVILIALVLLLLAHPVLRLELLGQVKRSLVVMIDRSASMGVADRREDVEDQQRVTLVSGAEAPTTQPLSRLQVVQAALKQPKLDLLGKLGATSELQVLTFDRTVTPVAVTPPDPLTWVDSLKPGPGSTALGDALRQAVGETSGRPATGVVLITDGASNAGTVDAISAARQAARAGLPVFVWGVGTTKSFDIAIESIEVPRLAFKDDELVVAVKLRSTGARGRSTKVAVTLGGKEVASKNVTFDTDGSRTELLRFKPTEDGEKPLRVQVGPMQGETVEANNSREQPVTVSSRKLRVLLVDRQPRWDFKYLEAALLRDRRVELKLWLIEADPEMARAENSPFLPSFPAELKDLATYDLVILGDVGPEELKVEQQQMLHEFVSTFGGGLAVVAGKGRDLFEFDGTPLAKLLPIELSTGPGLAARGGDETGFGIERTPAGVESGILDLQDDESDDTQTWLRLPELQWILPVDRAKPAAQVLAQTRLAPNGTSGQRPTPVIAIQQYGLGQTLYVGTDNLWRWRRNVGDKYYARLWGQFVQRLALAHLIGGGKRTQLSADRQLVEPGQSVVVTARLFDANLKPIVKPQGVRAVATGPDGKKQDVTLWPVPDQAGAYRGELLPSTAGRFTLSVVDSDEPGELAVDAIESTRELADVALNESLLKQIAEQTGGAYVREEGLARLPELIEAKRAPIKSNVELHLWSSPLVFVLLLLVAGTEWLLRRLWQLK